MLDTPSSTGRIFVSSTCYDLLDLRAELEASLKEVGLSPYLSDRPTSEFASAGDADSIATCLANLRDCEHCVLILSQRYGPSLKSAGFADVSATHLEYREAIAHGIPVTVYVRDRLLGEFELWQSNKNLVTKWARGDDGARLFEFLLEHKKLEKGGKPNWIWPFSSSVDLCRRVLGDLGATAAAARIRLLSDQGRLPLFSVTVGGHAGAVRSARLQNSGQVAGMRVSVRQPEGGVVVEPQDIGPGESRDFKFHCGMESFSHRGGYAPVLRVDYETQTGDRIRDLFVLLPAGAGAMRSAPAGRALAGRSLRTTCPEVVTVAGLAMVSLEPVNAAHSSNTL